MEYITVREAASKWNITVRQVQNLCNTGKIPKAIRFNSSWAIPEDVQKPMDGRKKPATGNAGSVRPFTPPGENEWMLSNFVTHFPYPIQIYSPDGILVLFNEAWQKRFNISDTAAEKMKGKYNILNDPLMEKWGVLDNVLRLFRGEIAHGKDMKAPLQEIADVFGEGDRVTENIYHDVLSFPVFDDCHRMIYAVIIFITSRLYRGNEEIAKGKEYIENHWQDKFDLDASAKASGLSKSHFAKLFKTHTGLTPHAFYLDVKIRMLQNKLMDSNLSVTQAFEECGMDYNSHYVGVFKERVGMTPMEFRKKGEGNS